MRARSDVWWRREEAQARAAVSSRAPLTGHDGDEQVEDCNLNEEEEGPEQDGRRRGEECRVHVACMA